MSSDKSPAASAASADYRIKAGSAWGSAWRVAGGLGVAGLAVTGFLARNDFHRWAFSYLFALYVFLTIGLGSLFFVVIQYLTKAWWSVSVRRTAEFFMMGLPAVVVLMLPLMLPQSMGELFPWSIGGAASMHGNEAEGGEAHPTHEGGAKAAPEGQPAKGPEHSMLETGEDSSEETAHLRGVTAQAAPPPAPRGAAPSAPPPHGPGAMPPGHTVVPGGAPSPHGFPGAGHPRPAGGAFGGHGDAGKKALEHDLKAAEEHEEEAVLDGKRPYLNRPFFWIRQVAFGIIWILVALRYFTWSTDQDKSKSMKITASAQQWAPLALALFGLSLTFSAFDWLMSLNPMWYSTIFGVCIFAGSVVAAMAVLVLTTLGLSHSGQLGNAVTVEHFHDLGKLLFGFLVFWAYVTFSQFFLIWYSSIPEELAFFHMRWTDNDGSWKAFVYIIAAGHFAVPFWLLMSRNVKRRPFWLGVGAFIILVMHVLEIYWLVLPNIGPFKFNLLDLSSLVGIGGIYFAAVLYRMQQHPLIPVGDPRLARALKFENA